jgi:hypothetical protein
MVKTTITILSIFIIQFAVGQTSKGLRYLNIDFMSRGYFYAYSTPKNADGDDESGGWASSPNKPRKISKSRFPNNQLAITIDTTRIDTFANQFFGYKLFVSNTTRDTVQFDAQDSRLNMKLQAQNDKGEWQDIEYLPGSWCGNSYHTIDLEPKAYWGFTIPNYQGRFKTKIRIELEYNDNVDPQQKKLVYSNVINGSINPGQFLNKEQYQSKGLMDPYDN